MNKEIKINPDLFKMSKPKTLKKKTLTGTEIKKALLETIQQKSEDPIMNAIQEIETIKECYLECEDCGEYTCEGNGECIDCGSEKLKEILEVNV